MAFTAPDADLVSDDPPQEGQSSAPSAGPATGGQGFSAPEVEVLNSNGHTPAEAARAYLATAGDGLPANIDRSVSWQDQAEQHYQAAKAYWDQSPLQRLDNSATGTMSDLRQHPLVTAEHAWNTASGAISGLYGRAKQGTADAWQETKQDFSDHPFLAPAHLLATVTVGGLQGLYNLGKMGAEGAGKISDVAAGFSPANADDPEAAGRYRATRDYLLRAYNQDVEAPAKANVRAASPLPAVQDFAENVVPAFVPLGETGVATKGADLLANAVPKAGGRLLQGTGKVLEVAAENAPVLSTGAALHAMENGGILHAAGDVVAGAAAKYVKPVATGIMNYGAQVATGGPSQLVGQAAAPALKAGLRGGITAVVDAQNAPTKIPFTAPPEELVTQ